MNEGVGESVTVYNDRKDELLQISSSNSKITMVESKIKIKFNFLFFNKLIFLE